VWFRYDIGLPWVLRGVSMYIPSGKSVALIGLNGAGKTSVVKLLCRMYDPERGGIYWDGIDIRDLSPGDLRARIGTVFHPGAMREAVGGAVTVPERKLLVTADNPSGADSRQWGFIQASDVLGPALKKLDALPETNDRIRCY
jgi:ABC-type branched-subunit amino acid transport system ATPase component